MHSNNPVDITQQELIELYRLFPDKTILLDQKLTIHESNQLIFLGLKYSFPPGNNYVPSDGFVREIMIYGGQQPTIGKIVLLTQRVASERLGVSENIQRCGHMMDIAGNFMRVDPDIRNDIDLGDRKNTN